jgi:hypothetical protein
VGQKGALSRPDLDFVDVATLAAGGPQTLQLLTCGPGGFQEGRYLRGSGLEAGKDHNPSLLGDFGNPIAHPARVTRVAGFGGRVYSCSEALEGIPAELRVWDLASGDELRVVRLEAGAASLDLSEHGALVLHGNGTIVVYPR